MQFLLVPTYFISQLNNNKYSLLFVLSSIQQIFSSYQMLNCFCAQTRKTTFSKKSKYYAEVSQRLNNAEIELLSLIYNDLASRNLQHLLTFDNFLIFFDLKGLWGAKLFKNFDEDGQHLVTLQEFLYGISRTAKAPMEQKIQLLYLFFQQKNQDGIDFKNFTKMLYNYSKEELKQILVKDGLANQQALLSNSQTIKPIKVLDCLKKPAQQQIIEINCTSATQSNTSFDVAYQSLIKYHDQGTFYEVNKNDFTYKIRYSNMSTLIKQFAAEVYTQNGINVSNNENARLKYQNFSDWIKSHKKLFISYYSAFHTDLWAFQDGDPNYLTQKPDLQFQGKLECGGIKKKVYGILIEDIIIFFEGRKKQRFPIKVICLEGLNIRSVDSLKIQISHPSECYIKTIIHFETAEQNRTWLEHLSMYERDCLHQNYIIGEVIGTGKFSIVYKCTQKQTLKTYALKVMDISKLTKQAIEMITNQSEIMKILHHPQLIKYKETIHTKNYQYLITQYVYGEDLYEYVRKRKNLKQFQSAFIIGNIIKAVIFLHGTGIIHRDLKPENIMVLFKNMEDNQMFECTSPNIRKGQRVQDIKIIDFGLSNYLSSIQNDEEGKVIGTPNYIAPQILLGGTPTFKSDNFSIGGILYFLLSGRLPFNCNNLEGTLVKTVKGQINLTTGKWKDISEQAKDLIQRLLQVQPKQRISLQQALNHQWFSSTYEKTKSEFSSDKHKNCHQKNLNEQIKVEFDDHIINQRASDCLGLKQEPQFDVNQINRRSF